MKKIFIALNLFFIIKTAYAVPPPDFIMQIASNIWIYFSIIFTFLSVTFFWTFNYLKLYIKKYKKNTLFLLILSVILTSYTLADYLDKTNIEKQNQIKTQEWIKYTREKEKNTEILENEDEIISERKEIDVTKLDLSIENLEVQELIESNGKNFTFIDVREDLEYDLWNNQNFKHIRAYDLVVNDYKRLDIENDIYILCLTWIRWKEVAQELYKKWFNVKYIQWWAKKWVDDWLEWNWTYRLHDRYKEKRYRLTFSKSEMIEHIKKRVTLIDVRNLESLWNKWFKDSINIDLQHLENNKLKQVLTKVWTDKEIITICDAYVNCFYAKLVWILLEEKWNYFLWRYPTPREF